MTEHRLSQGVAKVHDSARIVEIETWAQDRGGTMTFYREDADVLRYLADALESFDIPRPEESEEEPADYLTKPLPTLDQVSGQKELQAEETPEKKPVAVIAGSTATPASNEFALR